MSEYMEPDFGDEVPYEDECGRTCTYCGAEGLEWQPAGEDKWALFEGNGEQHVCPTPEFKMLRTSAGIIFKRTN